MSKQKTFASVCAIALAVMLSSCATLSSEPPDVFDTPQDYLGQKIRACGIATDGANLTQATESPHDQVSKGFVLTGNRSSSDMRKRGKLCVEGLVVFIGCKTDDVVCVGAAYNYGIEVQ